MNTNLDWTDLLTTTEAARLLRVTSATLHRWILHGQLPAVRNGRRYLIPRAAVLDRLAMIQPVTVPRVQAPAVGMDRLTQAALARHGIKAE